jgi:hypothetical protein
MERSRLKVRTGMRYAGLNPILDEMAREGRIKDRLWKTRRYRNFDESIGRKMSILFSYVT